MAKITVQLWDPNRETYGERLSIIEQPHVRDTKGKTKSRLKDHSLSPESDKFVEPSQKVSEVRVSKANWLGRREKGDAY